MESIDNFNQNESIVDISSGQIQLQELFILYCNKIILFYILVHLNKTNSIVSKQTEDETIRLELSDNSFDENDVVTNNNNIHTLKQYKVNKINTQL